PGVDIVSYPKDLGFYRDDEMPELLERRIRQIRGVLSDKCAQQQAEKVLREAGVELPVRRRPRLLAVTEKGVSQEGLDGIEAEVDVSFLRETDLSPERLSEFDYVAFFDSALSYEPHYMRDMINAF